MKDGYLEAEDIIRPLPIYRRADDKLIGIMDAPSESGTCRLRALQGQSLNCDAYALFVDPETQQRHEISLPGHSYKEFYDKLVERGAEIPRQPVSEGTLGQGDTEWGARRRPPGEEG